ncbi:MAG: SCP2 sterol-binding domain-containing protein [Acidimicrobiales bacterium]
MTRYDQDWVDALVDGASVAAATVHAPMRVLWIVTETDDGKHAFHIDLDGSRPVSGTAGRLPRGESAAVTVTAKESALLPLWRGERDLDTAFMAGDLKIEGSYERWLDELVPAFRSDPWAAAWVAAVAD